LIEQNEISDNQYIEYDPFGNIVKESYLPSYNTSSFSYKFSTKPLDLTTELYYYTYRYYHKQQALLSIRNHFDTSRKIVAPPHQTSRCVLITGAARLRGHVTCAV
jgi:hypothetical protein